MSTEQWQELLDNNRWNNVSLRDARYDQVIHLVFIIYVEQGSFLLEGNSKLIHVH